MSVRIGAMVVLLGILVMGCGGDGEETDAPVSDASATPEGGSEETEAQNEEASGEEGEGEEEEQVEEADKGSLGDPCASDDECASLSGYPTCITTTLIKTLGLSDNAEVPGGYCSDMTCEASSECGDEGVQCVDLGASEVTDLFNICLKGCDAGDEAACGEGQQCYCDEDGGIFNTEGETDFCTCMPDAIIDLLT